MMVREPGLGSFSLPSRQVELNLFNIREGFRQAAEYLKKVAEAKAKKSKSPKMSSKIARYVTILKNETPTVVRASTRQQIRDILEIRDKYPFDVVIDGPLRGYAMARELAARKIPVLLTCRGPDFDSPSTRCCSEDVARTLRFGSLPSRVPL